MKIGILTSGILGYTVLKQLFQDYDIAFVFTDKGSEEIIHFTTQEGIDTFIGNPRRKSAENFISDKKVDILISINYLFIIEDDLINLPTKFAFNIHGSLLPKYRGRAPHVWAIINNETKTGITAHIIDPGCDTGRVIKQIEISILPQDTGADILNKFKANYFPLIEHILKTSDNDQEIITYNQDENLATYFGKRTPEDGLIQWNWQKERIHNWVRAQAHPYPGAFTFLGNNKLTIDKIEFTDYGYNSQTPNGQILALSPLLIKTTNGVISIISSRENIPLTIGSTFNNMPNE